MLLEEALYSKLTGTAAITALVGTRIFPGYLPQTAALPAMSYWRVAGMREHAQGTDPGVARPRIQIDAWGKKYSQVQSVADALRTALQDSSGLWGGVGGVTILAVHYYGDSHFYEDETEVHHIASEFVIWHSESRT